jgi:glyoxylase-like metal-dependent hydrolase (beta-lactamase superfamily II)
MGDVPAGTSPSSSASRSFSEPGRGHRISGADCPSRRRSTSSPIDNIRKTGVDPTAIKYVLITHGHFDHAGGADKLKPLTRAQFLMTQKGWHEAIESAKASLGTPRPSTMIPQDRVVNDGDVIHLGEQGVRVLETPGHTWGTASYRFQVTDGDKSYRRSRSAGCPKRSAGRVREGLP